MKAIENRWKHLKWKKEEKKEEEKRKKKTVENGGKQLKTVESSWKQLKRVKMGWKPFSILFLSGFLMGFPKLSFKQLWACHNRIQ